ncbi:hypothetical protein [Actinacidiphila yeochonensis]|uniref:hypothetical protein n=1 Tax=Actinacidiphila yeochonensis TaxID=89050 RepID=UPI001E31CF63|nr:hypothetical protein [Actinacidiphila yeochonensis]
MLTDPASAERAREALGRQVRAVGEGLREGRRDGRADGGAAGSEASAAADGDVELRAALSVAAVLGVTIAHQLLELPVLREAEAARAAALLRPALRALLDDEGAPDGGPVAGSGS